VFSFNGIRADKHPAPAALLVQTHECRTHKDHPRQFWIARDVSGVTKEIGPAATAPRSKTKLQRFASRTPHQISLEGRRAFRTSGGSTRTAISIRFRSNVQVDMSDNSICGLEQAHVLIGTRVRQSGVRTTKTPRSFIRTLQTARDFEPVFAGQRSTGDDRIRGRRRAQGNAGWMERQGPAGKLGPEKPGIETRTRHTSEWLIDGPDHPRA